MGDVIVGTATAIDATITANDPVAAAGADKGATSIGAGVAAVAGAGEATGAGDTGDAGDALAGSATPETATPP